MIMHGRNKICRIFPKSSKDSNLGLTWVDVDNQAWENYVISQKENTINVPWDTDFCPNTLQKQKNECSRNVMSPKIILKVWDPI